MVITGQVSRLRSLAVAVLALAVAAVSIGGLVRADTDFREAELAHRTAYLGEARAWLERAYGLNLTDEELSEVVTTQGVTGRFDGATTLITVRGDRDSGKLVVVDRNGEEIAPVVE